MSYIEEKTREVRPDVALRGRIGDRLRESGKLDENDINRILLAQSRSNSKFGEAAVELNLLTAEEVNVALSQQYTYPVLQSEAMAWSPEVFAARDPFGAQSEAIRTLRSELVLRGIGDSTKTIAVVGSNRDDGASIASANLAVAFAQLGERTLLIDANMRDPRQHLLFGIAESRGLSSVLDGRCAMSDVVSQMHPFENLSVLTAGPPPPNPQELLGQIEFAYLVETAPAAFDLVIIDTPPLQEFADAQTVARRAGSCLCVARRHNTKLSDIAQLKAQMDRAGALVVGAVVWD
jgi:receptor protein-tyrosine kinase